MNNKDKSIITKENLINLVLSKCREDYISTEDLLKLIDGAIDEDGVISKKRLIKSIKNSNTKSTIKDIYNLLEKVIFNTLSSANSECDVSIRLFEGITLDATYMPETTMISNLTGKPMLIESKIKPKFNITRNYCNKLNNK